MCETSSSSSASPSAIGGQIGIDGCERQIGRHQGHRVAQPAIGLRQLQRLSRATDHQQMRQLAGVVENRLGGEERHGIEAGDLRHPRFGTGGDHIAVGANLRAVDTNRALVDKAGRAGDELGADRLEMRWRRRGPQRCDHLSHMLMHAAEADACAIDGNAEAAGVTHGVESGCGGSQRTGRHHAGVQRVAANAAPFHHQNAGARGTGCLGHRQPSGTGSDHTEVRSKIFRQFSPLSPRRLICGVRHARFRPILARMGRMRHWSGGRRQQASAGFLPAARQ